MPSEGSSRAKRARVPTERSIYAAEHPEALGAPSNRQLAFSPAPSTPLSAPVASTPATPFPTPSVLEHTTSDTMPSAPSDPTVSIPTSDTRPIASPLMDAPATASTLAPKVTLPTAAAPPEDYRLHISGRATVNCAASSPYFRKKLAIAYAFLEVHDIQLDELGQLASCQLKCCHCIDGRGVWMVTKKSGGSTKNFNDHMQARHPAIWMKAKKKEADALGLESSSNQRDLASMLIASPSFDIDVWWDKLGRWIVLTNQPFTAIESEELRDWILYLKPALIGKLIGGDQLREKIIDDLYATYREAFKETLGAVPGAIPFACDAWTSSNNHAFLAITGSWITKDWELKTTLLDFIELLGAHSGENMGGITFQALKELGILKKLITQSTDSASNNNTMFDEVSRLVALCSIQSWWNASESQIRCLAHIIHLAVMALLSGIKAIPKGTSATSDANLSELSVEEAEDLVTDPEALPQLDGDATVDLDVNLQSAIDKLRKICKITRSSPQRSLMFLHTVERIEDHNAIAEPGYKKRRPKKLIIDVVTRWSSTCFMLERGLEYREAIDDLCDNHRLKIYSPYHLTEDDWATIKVVLSWLKVFRAASQYMSGERYPTLSLSLVTYVSLLKHIDNIAKSSVAVGSPSLLQGLVAAREKLLKFFDCSTFESEYYYFATVLDPRYKVSLFLTNPDLFGDDWVKSCHDSMIDTLTEDYCATPTPEHVPAAMSIDGADELQLLINSVLGHSASSLPLPNSVSQELKTYLGEPVSTEEPLAWWRGNQRRFPSLAHMARNVLAIPGSSVSVERVLNLGRDTISLRRGSLRAGTITKLMNLRGMMLLEKSMSPRVGEKRKRGL